MSKLTESKCKALTKAGKYADGAGLSLKVAAGGSKSWVFRHTVNGKPKDEGLGGWPAVSVKAAREAATTARARAKRQPVSAMTFREAAERTIEVRSATWKPGSSHHVLFPTTLERFVYPTLGDRPVSEITRAEIYDLLQTVYAKLPGQGRKVESAIRSVMKWAETAGRRSDNPALGSFGLGQKTELRKSCSADAAPAVFAAFMVNDGPRPLSRLLLAFVMLTGVRLGNARLAEWSEIDMATRTWIVPSAKTKTSMGDLRVPLSDASVAVLERAAELHGRDGVIFRSAKGKAFDPSAAYLCMVDMELGGKGKMTIHGFRSTLATWAQKQGIPLEVRRAILGHRESAREVDAIYSRDDHLEARRAIMDAWGAHLTG